MRVSSLDGVHVIRGALASVSAAAHDSTSALHDAVVLEPEV